MPDQPRWGVVATVKAPLREIMGFAAHHVEAGAHRVYLYLDDADAAQAEALNAHPRLRVTVTDDTYWQKRGRRPEKHQVRQTRNVRHALNRRQEVDWLAHIDVDEFLVSDQPLGAVLCALPPDCLCARVRPVEGLANPGGGPPVWFKAFPLPHAERRAAAKAVFPTYGAQLNGGFLSHVAGKLLFRTGIDGLRAQIHNVFLDDRKNPGEVELVGVELAHLHATDWDRWQAHYSYRHAHGAYRSELKPAIDRAHGGETMHELLARLEAAGALRSFFEEACTATEARREALASHGLLRRYDLDLDAKIARHFPES